MRHALFSVFCLWPGASLAHGGHIGDLAGHDHVVIGLVIGGLILAGLLAGASKGHDEDLVEAEDEDREGTPS